ncbi:DUF1440 domain-containing protein [Telluribacter sp.]|jgi:hypothetical protein|uniref:DUF1440 domain-containing protein n=1 Tax=Telluribacter sp. TaxID=1978767 RepID=UPI002E0D5F93|nr:DUF1440 domain-containing protein [Telluribacter sp.]
MTSAKKELLKGAIAGAAAVWLMDRMTRYMYRHESQEAYEQEKEAQIGGKSVAFVAANKMAGAASVKLNDQQEYIAGKTVHYLMGVVPGALYALLRHRIKGLNKAHGLLYGLGLFIVVDELMVPAAGLASGPLAYPWQAHARGLVGHLRLGLSTDTVVRALDKVVD